MRHAANRIITMITIFLAHQVADDLSIFNREWEDVGHGA